MTMLLKDSSKPSKKRVQRTKHALWTPTQNEQMPMPEPPSPNFAEGQ